MVGKPPKIISASLLSVEEATTFLTENERKYNGWWWRRSPGFTWNSAASVDYNGSVEYYGYFVEENDGLVRPALIIDPTPLCFKIGDRFMFGTKCFKIISDNLAFCMRDIGRCCFRITSGNPRQFNCRDDSVLCWQK